MSNGDLCRKDQLEQGIPDSSFNNAMHYGDRAKIFHRHLSQLLNDMREYPRGNPNIKDYIRLVDDIEDSYYRYFNYQLVDLLGNQQNHIHIIEKTKYSDKSKMFHKDLADMINLVREDFYADVKSYVILLTDIETSYYKYFDQCLSVLLIK
jgi:hypothetical protein